MPMLDFNLPRSSKFTFPITGPTMKLPVSWVYVDREAHR